MKVDKISWALNTDGGQGGGGQKAFDHTQRRASFQRAHREGVAGKRD